MKMSWKPLWLLAIGCLPACGSSDGEDASRSHEEYKIGWTRAEKGDAWRTADELQFDGKPVLWDFELLINDKSIFLERDATKARIVELLDEARVEKDDQGELRLSLRIPKEAGSVLLATNVEAVAREAGRGEYWQANCAKTSGVFAVTEDMIETAKARRPFGQEKELATLQLGFELCDFERVLSAPTSRIDTSAAAKAEAYPVTYECSVPLRPDRPYDSAVFDVETSSGDALASCRIKRTDRPIAYPEGIRKDFTLQLDNYNLLHKVGSNEVALEKDDVFVNLHLAEQTLPLGRYESCSNLQFLLKARDGQAKSLTWKRVLVDADRAYTWEPTWTDSSINYTNLVQDPALSRSSATIVMHCSWSADAAITVIRE